MDNATRTPQLNRIILEPTSSLSRASSLLRASSLEFEKAYNHHINLKVKLEEKNRVILISQNSQNRMNSIARGKENMKASLCNFNDSSGRALADQTSNNNELRAKREESMRKIKEERQLKSNERALMIRESLKELHVKLRMNKENREVESFVKRRNMYDQYFEAIESRVNKNK